MREPLNVIYFINVIYIMSAVKKHSSPRLQLLRLSEMRSREFGPVFKVDRMMKETLDNGKEKEPLT